MKLVAGQAGLAAKGRRQLTKTNVSHCVRRHGSMPAVKSWHSRTGVDAVRLPEKQGPNLALLFWAMTHWASPLSPFLFCE